MKKLFSLILALALLLPSAVLADGPVGCWASYEMTDSGTPNMQMLFLAEDHTCFYLVQTYHDDEPGIGRQLVGTWEMQPDGMVIAKTGNNTKTRLTFSDDYAVALNWEYGAYMINLSYLFDMYEGSK